MKRSADVYSHVQNLGYYNWVDRFVSPQKAAFEIGADAFFTAVSLNGLVKLYQFTSASAVSNIQNFSVAGQCLDAVVFKNVRGEWNLVATSTSANASKLFARDAAGVWSHTQTLPVAGNSGVDHTVKGGKDYLMFAVNGVAANSEQLIETVVI